MMTISIKIQQGQSTEFYCRTLNFIGKKSQSDEGKNNKKTNMHVAQSNRLAIINNSKYRSK